MNETFTLAHNETKKVDLTNSTQSVFRKSVRSTCQITTRKREKMVFLLNHPKANNRCRLMKDG